MSIDLTRRRFFGFLAAPAIVRATSLMPISVLADDYLDALAESFVQTEEILHANVLNRAAIRDLLLPGLAGLVGQYSQIPRQWPQVFARVT